MAAATDADTGSALPAAPTQTAPALVSLSRADALAGLRATGVALLGSSRALIDRLIETMPPGPALRRLESRRLALVVGPGEGLLASVITDVGDIGTVIAAVGAATVMLLHNLSGEEPLWGLTLRLLFWTLAPVAALGLVAAALRAAGTHIAERLARRATRPRRPSERLLAFALELRWDRVLELLEDDHLRAHVPQLLAIALAYLPYLAATPLDAALLDEHVAVIDRFSVELGLAALPGLGAAVDAVQRTTGDEDQKGRLVAALLRISETVDGSRGPMR
jgi:hypothetical protein